METRKSLIGRLMALGLLLASCAPAAAPAAKPAAPAAKAEPTAKPAGAPAAPAATPKPAPEQPKSGGVLTAVAWEDPPSYDVHQESNFVAQGMLLLFYSGLVQYDPLDPEKIVPDLAEKWEIAPDGKTLTFSLRSGVTFHDGKELTPADVKLSLDRLRDPPRGVLSNRQPTLAPISGVETLGNNVRVTLKYPSASILSMLSVGQIVVFPKHVLDDRGNMKRDIVGTGPYKLKQHNMGSTFEAVKNTRYFVPQRPYLDGVTLYIIRDAGTRLAAFRTGRVKLYGGAGPGPKVSEGEIITKEVKGSSVIRFPGLTYRALLFNSKEQPWNDARVRRAASLAIDRRAAVNSLTQGSGAVGGYFVPGTQWATPPEELMKLPGYRDPKDEDIAAAKRLLAEAGFPNGFKSKLLASATLSRELAVFLADQLAKVNITAEIEVVEHGVFASRMNRKQFVILAQPPGLRSADPVEIGRYFVSGCLSCGALEDKNIDDLFSKADQTLDANERRKITRELDRYLMDVVPSAIVYHGNENVALAPEVRNYKPGYGWYNNNRYQDVWLAR
ncbi:MAG: ABC transporter substrate-binding protein [Chloroflexi bacterium]|nr:ABC transporter substrate-binding protein [Chloroflexota bacterium]